jgi:hypothetical protein
MCSVVGLVDVEPTLPLISQFVGHSLRCIFDPHVAKVVANRVDGLPLHLLKPVMREVSCGAAKMFVIL